MSQNSNTQKSLKIFFFGAPYFSRKILDNLLDNDISIDYVITHPDQPVGRKKILTPTPTKILALANNISVKEFYKLDEKALAFFKKEKPDLFIVASYGSILPAELLTIPKFGALNVHPSLLPKLRGASPIQISLLQGLSKTGTSIMLMDKGMDTGNIIEQDKLSINPKETYFELENRLANLSNILLLPIIKEIAKTKQKPKSTVQNHNEATYTKLIKKQDGLIAWDKTAQEIYNQWRAFCVWPKIHTFYNNQKLTLTRIELSPENDIIIGNSNISIGEVCTNTARELLIKTGKGTIKINRLQLAGKNEMDSKEFLNGQSAILGTILK